MKTGDSESAARFDRGLVELRCYQMQFDEAALARAVASFRAATQLSPGTSEYWVALGFALDAKDDPGAALAALRRATELDPADEEAEVFVLTLLAEAGLEAEALSGIEAVADRTGVDLDSLRREIQEAEMPLDARALLENGFLRPRNFVRSRLDDAMDRAERALDPLGSGLEADLEDCRDRLAELEREIEPDAVPAAFRHLVRWVLRLGVGDDPCRALLIDELKQDERAEVMRDFEEHAAAIHTWLDSFDDGAFPAEATAFMYSLLALEEMKTQEEQ